MLFLLLCGGPGGGVVRHYAGLALAVSAFLLTACDMTMAVKGVLGADEALSGSLTHYSDGGTIELFGGPRTHCVGNFTYKRGGKEAIFGRGTLVCDDRRAGPFSFTLKGMKHGSGTGSLSGQPYSFTF